MHMKDIPPNVTSQFNYVDGQLYWRELGTGRKPGPVGNLCRGYLAVMCHKKMYYVHRIIWVMHHGDTHLQIDHINRDRTDNRLSNLRAVTKSMNLFNSNRGVAWCTQSGKYRVTWSKKYICSTHDMFEAWCIRKSMEAKHIGL